MKYETDIVDYGSLQIEYDIQYTSRTKTMEIAVHPDTQVIVTAPFNTPPDKIKSKVKKRVKWINKQRNYFLQFQPRKSEKYYISGETHLYLGRRYKLKIRKGSTDKVNLLRGEIYVSSKNKNIPSYNKKLLDLWYFEKAHIKFQECFDECWEVIGKERDSKPNLKIRKMKSRWGSLSKKGTLTLNLKLIQASKYCIEYVIMHELCHLIYHNHSKHFYQLLEKILPDWGKRKHRLELTLI